MLDSYFSKFKNEEISLVYETIFKREDFALFTVQKKEKIISFFENKDNVDDIITSLNDKELRVLTLLNFKQEISFNQLTFKLISYGLVNDFTLNPSLRESLSNVNILYNKSVNRVNIKEFIKAYYSLISSNYININSSIGMKVSKMKPVFSYLTEEEIEAIISDIDERGKQDKHFYKTHFGKRLSADTLPKILKENDEVITYYLQNSKEKPISFMYKLIIGEGLKYYTQINNSKREAEYTLTNDLSIYYEASTNEEFIYRFAMPVVVDSICQYRVTKQTIREAFDNGLTADEIISYFTAKGDENSMLFSRIKAWEEEYERVQFYNCFYFEAATPIIKLILQIDILSKYIIKEVGPNAILVKKDPFFFDYLRHNGFDMIKLPLDLFEVDKGDNYYTYLSRYIIDSREWPLFLKNEARELERDFKMELLEILKSKKLPFLKSKHFESLIKAGKIAARSQLDMDAEFKSMNKICALDYNEKVNYIKSSLQLRVLKLTLKGNKFGVYLPISLNDKALTCYNIKSLEKEVLNIDKIFYVENIYY